MTILPVQEQDKITTALNFELLTFHNVDIRVNGGEFGQEKLITMTLLQYRRTKGGSGVGLWLMP